MAFALPNRWQERLTQFHDLYASGPAMRTEPCRPSTIRAEVPVDSSLKILGEILGIPHGTQPTGSIRLVDSHQAVMRDGTGTAAIARISGCGRGRGLALSLARRKIRFSLLAGWTKPCLVDSGVCNYDETLRATWYLNAPAHNTILVDGLGDGDVAKKYSGKVTEVGSCISD